MFEDKAGAYPRVEHLKSASFSQAPALPPNMRLGYKGLPGTNTLTYYENPYITDIKSFITLGPGVIAIKLFTTAI